MYGTIVVYLRQSSYVGQKYMPKQRYIETTSLVTQRKDSIVGGRSFIMVTARDGNRLNCQ